MIDWQRYPLLAQVDQGQNWVQLQDHLGLSKNTLDAYCRAMGDYLRFCEGSFVKPIMATREHIALYIHDMRSRVKSDGTVGLANATMQQRLTAIRHFYDFLVENALLERNPIGRGKYIPGYANQNRRGLIPRQRRLPWIPSDSQWSIILQTARSESIRNRTMLAFAYDAALRREELCALEISDIDPAYRLIHIRAETTKNQQSRIVPYSTVTDQLYSDYLARRRTLSRQRGALFLSESRRNSAQPLSIWSWSKAVQNLAKRAQIPGLTTHTFRHLCLTDLARSGWDIDEIALFAGHRSIQSTMTYIHLSGRDLAEKMKQQMDEIHHWRIQVMTEVWS